MTDNVLKLLELGRGGLLQEIFFWWWISVGKNPEVSWEPVCEIIKIVLDIFKLVTIKFWKFTLDFRVGQHCIFSRPESDFSPRSGPR